MQCPRCYYTNAAGSRVCDYCGARLDQGTDPVGDGGGAASSKRKTVLGPAPGAPAAPRPRENPAPRLDPKDPFRIAAEGIASPAPTAPPPAPPPLPAPAPVIPSIAPVAPAPVVPRARPTMIVGMPPSDTPAQPLLAGVALVVPPSGDARSVILREGRTRVGRRADLEIVVDDPKASTEHALIRVENGEAWMLDTSANGTLVAGRRCLNDRAVVTDGTVLRIGDTLIVLKILSAECLAQLAADDS